MPSQLHKVKIGLVQMRCSMDPKENLAKAIAKTREAAEKGAQIVCLQELFTSVYFCQVEDLKYFHLAEEIPGPSTEALSEVAKEKGVVIVAHAAAPGANTAGARPGIGLEAARHGQLGLSIKAARPF